MKKELETIIELKDVHKSYFLDNGEEIEVLKGINLKIRKGEFVALMGESGGGKSTLLNIIACLHPLNSGHYYLEGDNIGEVKDEDILAFIRNKKMGFIFQQFNLLPRLSALQNVELPALYNGTPENERISKAKELLTKVGLADKFINKPGELSGGQQQRVSIARSLINDTEILLADEPTGALDSVTSHEVMELIKTLKTEGKTIVMVTHDPEVAKVSDRIIFLKDGKVTDCNYKITD
ncbi:MAG: ABC transporter ATP-binding protein [Candidatus Gracilibacteria bacterium]